ncbi:MAG: ABC transporter ATP-binding protein/permease [Treponema sp.]|nr:ABC transporter ATP-binding protein/permease [Treponema sp.]
MADSGYFETDDVTKEYDSRLVRRILSYLKPYKLFVGLTLAALVFSTLGELCIPVLQQRIIDRDVLARFLAFSSRRFDEERDNIKSETAAAYLELISLPTAVRAGDYIFIPHDHRTALQGSSEGELKARGIMDSEQWYAFPCREEDPAMTVVLAHPDIFLLEEYAAVRNRDLYSLSTTEILAIRGRDISALVRGGVLLLFIFLLVFLFTYFQTWTSNRITQRVMKDIRLALFEKTASQSTAFLSRHPVGRIVTRLTGDVETMDEFFTTVLTAFIKDIFIMAGTLITLFILSPPMALAVIVTLPPVLIVTLASRVKARDAFRKQRTASSKVYSYLAERLAGIQVVQLFRQEKKSSSEFRERNRELLAANLGEMYVFATFRPLVEWFSTLTAAVVIVLGSKMVLSLSISLGVLIAFISLVQMFYSPVTDIAEKYTLLQSAMAGGERVFKLMDTEERIPDTGVHSTGTDAGGLPACGRVEFDNVCFGYKESEDVLKGLSFSIEPGQTAAIVGYTGAGKTTIINVLSRLWDVDSGEIRLNGVPVKNIPLSDLRRCVLPVLQDVFLFSGTVEENISLGLGLSQEEIIEAAKAVHAHDFITGLENGYKTVLSEGAANISSGQRQLISFARVIAHNPMVVILDEATSSIDTETEHLIQLGMEKVLSGRTSFVIAHRLSTIKNADRILVLSAGRIVEEGRHEDLIACNGLYAHLYRLQYSNSL